MKIPLISQSLPDWLQEAVTPGQTIPDASARMRLAIDLARRNIEHQSGGPFGAAVFDRRDDRLVSVGINLVVASGLSIAHAEIVALSSAQQLLDTYDLSVGGGSYELVTSSEPCAMCFGAIPWSGIRRVLCGATHADACAIGFDEGPRHPQWIEELTGRGIEVQTEVCRSEAVGVLDAYAAMGGALYNGRSTD